MSAAPFHSCSSLCRAILILGNLIYPEQESSLECPPSNAPLALLAWGSVPACLGPVSVRRSSLLMHKHLLYFTALQYARCCIAFYWRLLNRPFSRRRHLTTTIRVHFIFPFLFKFANPSEINSNLKDSGSCSKMKSSSSVIEHKLISLNPQWSWLEWIP